MAMTDTVTVLFSHTYHDLIQTIELNLCEIFPNIIRNNSSVKSSPRESVTSYCHQLSHHVLRKLRVVRLCTLGNVIICKSVTESQSLITESIITSQLSSVITGHFNNNWAIIGHYDSLLTYLLSINVNVFSLLLIIRRGKSKFK